MCPGQGLCRGAGDENRTRTVSLGIVKPPHGQEVFPQVKSGPEWPGVTWVVLGSWPANGPNGQACFLENEAWLR